MTGGDEGSDDVLADLPQDRHAGSLGVSDLERELFEQSLTGSASGRGGAGGGHLLEPPGREGSDGTVRFTIGDYLAQERSRRTFGTVVKPLHASAHRSSAGPGSPGDRHAPNAGSIVRREREKTILRHLNNMTDRGTYTTGHSRFDLDPQGHLKESVYHQHGDGHDGHAEILPWYAPPIQRQRWNEDHVLPHVDWGDLFYDLFYVGAAYNFGVMLTSAVATGNWTAGIIYFVGTFGPLWVAWENSVQHAARFTCVDYFHWIYEVVRYIFVGTAVAHVSIIKNMDDGSSDALAFTIAILCESLMNLGRTVETYYKAEGDRECIKSHCLRDMKYKNLPYIAVVLSSLAVEISFHFDENSDEYSSGSRRLAGDYGDDPYDTGTTNPYRWDYGDLPLTLLAIGYVSGQVLEAIGEWRAVNAKLDIRSRFVPMNTEMLIHRYGEWLLLMIGEGILSLLIVETTPTLSHYIITTCGLLTMIFIQVITFESSPSHAEDHALLRSLRSAFAYSYLIQILSMSLVAFGVTYKVLLKNEYAEAEYDKASRLLAASPKVEPETAATLFSGGLTAVLVALELLTLTHGGFEKAWGSLFKSSGNSSAYNWPVILMTAFKIGLFGFTATLNLWTSESHTLAYCGCAVVMAIAFSRVFIFKFIQKVLSQR